MDTRVLIAGAGPVGLTMALLLARKGISLRIVDEAPARTDLSKALVVWSRTLELLEIEGLAQPLLDAGMPAHGVHLWDESAPLVSLDFGEARARTGYPFALMIPQRDTERILEAHLARFGVTVERRVALTGFDADDAGVTARLSHGGLDGGGGASVETCRADWLLGCDGAHSTVRHNLPAARFDGDTLPTRWMLADVALDGALPHDALSMFLGRDGMLAAIPFGAGRFRLIADTGEGADRKEGVDPGGAARLPAPSLADVQAVLDARCRVPARARDPQWLSRIVINERKVRDYRHGRVFLAGDAAHVHSPAGGQGMNTGMQDAVNLAWKLALVCAGDASPLLLDGYSPERSAIGDQVLRNAGNLTRLAMVRNPLLRRLRAFALGALGHVDAARSRMVDQFTELDLHYGAGSLTPGRAHAVPHAAHAIRPGDRVPDRPLGPDAGAGADAGAASLYALLACGRFVALSSGCPAVDVPPALRRLALAAAMAPAPGFEAGIVYVVRPDAYLLCSAHADDAAAVAGALALLDALRPSPDAPQAPRAPVTSGRASTGS